MPRTHTTAIFQGRRNDSKTAKDAYVWWLQQFAHAYPEVFTDGRVEIALKGRSRRYLARKVDDLYPNADHLAVDPNMHQQLENGWHVALNLSNTEKEGILYLLASIANLERDAWDWRPDGKERAASIDLRAIFKP